LRVCQNKKINQTKLTKATNTTTIGEQTKDKPSKRAELNQIDPISNPKHLKPNQSNNSKLSQTKKYRYKPNQIKHNPNYKKEEPNH
jgi:hypothetical protein